MFAKAQIKLLLAYGFALTTNKDQVLREEQTTLITMRGECPDERWGWDEEKSPDTSKTPL